tara:strand:- start:2538 stop:3086 length:549 start_codon:yes stop_codon:yes gene_type:complete
MGISTKKDKDNTSPTKREKVQSLMEKHKPLFEKEGVFNPKFIPRMAYKHEGELIVGFYPKEIYGDQNIYTEFCSRDYEPEDSQRRLWKWIYNPDFETEYKTSEPHPTTGDVRYFVPVDELIDVATQHKDNPEQLQLSLKDLDGDVPDMPYDAMSIRDYAAIKWKKPVSSKKWLNELITKNFK